MNCIICKLPPKLLKQLCRGKQDIAQIILLLEYLRELGIVNIEGSVQLGKDRTNVSQCQLVGNGLEYRMLYVAA